MPFFFLVPLWLVCVAGGLVLLVAGRLRTVGIYAITVSTGALLFSFALSTAVLYLGPRLLGGAHGSWLGIALIAAYICAIGFGGIGGAVAGFLGTRRMLRGSALQRG